MNDKKKNRKTFDMRAEDIEVLSGPEAVRMRPNLYGMTEEEVALKTDEELEKLLYGD